MTGYVTCAECGDEVPEARAAWQDDVGYWCMACLRRIMGRRS